MPNQDARATVWWIDDDHTGESGPRAGELRALMGQASGALDLVPIHPANFEKHVSNTANEKPPDLLLVDFRLGMQTLPDKETPFFARDGVRLRAVALGIDKLKDVPAYLISGVTRKQQFGSMNEHFDWVLGHRQLTRTLGGRFLLADATDYRRMRATLDNAGVGDPDDLERLLVRAMVDLLAAPAASVKPLEILLHREVARVLRTESALDSDQLKLAPSRPRAIARWVRSVLQRVRGPLIDPLKAATMLGTTVDYFEATLSPELDLDAARYTGIFRTTADMTLWHQALMERLLLASETIELSPPSALARTAVKHFNVPEHKLAVCRVCGGHWPEAVGSDGEDRSVEAPVHWRCSEEAPNADALSDFDVVRSFSS